MVYLKYVIDQIQRTVKTIVSKCIKIVNFNLKIIFNVFEYSQPLPTLSLT